MPKDGNADKVIKLNSRRIACSKTKTDCVSNMQRKFRELVATTTVFIALATVFIGMATVFIGYGDRLHGDKVPRK
ncbi:hypothetical protein DWU89_00585 [Parabacteroides acidifaciens]|uniref:Uncharacterized protein n=1 Tax=Parabacteroides acidifaciens TaxID=2290935 RepID=A0A3D8HJP8_9BACT|nr:hypothetical protein DWU89_00585 [Parabacteroides acidifaciens]